MKKYRRRLGTTTDTRSAAVAVAIGAILAVTACGSGGDGAADSSSGAGASDQKVQAAAKNDKAIAQLPDEIKKRGEIVVAMDFSSPPNHFTAKDGKTVVGVDADMAKLLGQALGMKVKIAGANFDDIIPGLAGKKYDIAIAQMSATKERQKVLDFVDYFSSGTAVAVKAGNPQKLGLDNLCGRKIAVLKGSFQQSVRLPGFSDKCSKAGKPAIEAKAFPDQQATVLALTSGRVEGVMQDSPVLDYAKKEGAAIDIAGVAFVSPVGIGITKGSGLLEPIHTAMEDLVTSKSYQQVLDKWGVSDSGVKEAKINNITD